MRSCFVFVNLLERARICDPFWSGMLAAVAPIFWAPIFWASRIHWKKSCTLFFPNSVTIGILRNLEQCQQAQFPFYLLQKRMQFFTFEICSLGLLFWVRKLLQWFSKQSQTIWQQEGKYGFSIFELSEKVLLWNIVEHDGFLDPVPCAVHEPLLAGGAWSLQTFSFYPTFLRRTVCLEKNSFRCFEVFPNDINIADFVLTLWESCIGTVCNHSRITSLFLAFPSRVQLYLNSKVNTAINWTQALQLMVTKPFYIFAAFIMAILGE